MEQFYCEICQTKVSGVENMKKHKRGKKHKKMVGRNNPPKRGSNSDCDHKDKKNLKCNICNIELSGKESYQQHMNGKKHKKMVDKRKEQKSGSNRDKDEKFLKCRICNSKVELSGKESYQQHMNGKKHKKMVDKRKELKRGSGSNQGNSGNGGRSGSGSNQDGSNKIDHYQVNAAKTFGMRMEQFLKVNGYSGTLYNAINKFCKEKNVDQKVKKMMHMLRKNRNFVAHAPASQIGWCSSVDYYGDAKKLTAYENYI